MITIPSSSFNKIDLPSLAPNISSTHDINIPSSAHSMKTRAKSGVFKPKAYTATCVISEPKHWKAAMDPSEKML